MDSIDAINDQINSFIIGGKYGFEFIPMEDIAKRLGVSAVGLRFMFGILVGKYAFHLDCSLCSFVHVCD